MKMFRKYFGLNNKVKDYIMILLVLLAISMLLTVVYL